MDLAKNKTPQNAAGFFHFYLHKKIWDCVKPKKKQDHKDLAKMLFL